LLPKNRRLKQRKDFDYLFREGRILQTPSLRVVYLPGSGRLAVVAAKGIGSLAHRNTVRRRWREALRMMTSDFEHWDAVFVVKASGALVRGEAIVEELQSVVSKLKL
jgi:ribonuclease P protein component